ncbi:hypothetical protein [Streptomyces sp. Z26]|nr:hypothetical protein [Streptomyces sp. Z26]
MDRGADAAQHGHAQRPAELRTALQQSGHGARLCGGPGEDEGQG